MAFVILEEFKCIHCGKVVIELEDECPTFIKAGPVCCEECYKKLKGSIVLELPHDMLEPQHFFESDSDQTIIDSKHWELANRIIELIREGILTINKGDGP